MNLIEYFAILTKRSERRNIELFIVSKICRHSAGANTLIRWTRGEGIFLRKMFRPGPTISFSVRSTMKPSARSADLSTVQRSPSGTLHTSHTALRVHKVADIPDGPRTTRTVIVGDRPERVLKAAMSDINGD